MTLQEKAESIARELMEVASGIREGGEEVQMMVAFSMPEEGVDLVPANMIPHSDKQELTERVRILAAHLEAEAVFTVCEAWLSLNPLAGKPSEDPARTEAIMVTASGAGVNFMLTREIGADGALGEVQRVQASGGRFTNLSGREMMN